MIDTIPRHIGAWARDFCSDREEEISQTKKLVMIEANLQHVVA